MGWVSRVFQLQNCSLVLTLMQSLIIPLIEYYCQLWNPWKAKDIQAIEAIQRTFTCKISEVLHLNYWERLHKQIFWQLKPKYSYCIFLKGLCWFSVCWILNNALFHVLGVFWFLFCVLLYHKYLSPYAVLSSKYI